MILDILSYILKNIRQRKLRSLLTMLSILLGIMAIFFFISFGQGLQDYVKGFAEEAGTDKLIAQPKGFGPPGSTGVFFTGDDIEVIQKTRGVKESAPTYFNYAQIKLDEDARGKFVQLLAGEPGAQLDLIQETFTMKVLEGRQIDKRERGRVMLGYLYTQPSKVFEKRVQLGDKIIVNEREFKVVGFYDEVGNTQDDTSVYMANDDFEDLFGIKEQYVFLVIRAESGAEPRKLATEITRRLGNERGVDEGEEDFTIQTFEQAIETFGIVVNIINGILVLIALISVVVATINIANTMYTAVLERTNEIGIMKAVGARNGHIMMIFVLEAGIIGLLGGAIGVLLGYGFAKIVGYGVALAGYSLLYPVFPIWLTIGCLLFSFLVGSAAGYFPARRASILKPVDALRYE